MRKYGIYKESLIVKLTKAVKKKYSELKKSGETSGKVEIHFNGEVVSIDDVKFTINFPETCNPLEIIDEVLKQAKCMAKINMEGNHVTIVLYKPVCREFIMLQRLLEKYASYNLAWDELFTEYTNHDGVYIYEYVCHNNILCKITCDFIKTNRKATDKLGVTIKEVNSETSDMHAKIIQIDVLTKNGCLKVSQEL